MKLKLWMVFLIFLLLSAQAFATGINVLINDGAIKDRAGSSLPDSDYHPYASKMEFFYGSMPAPNSSAGKLSVDIATQYTKVGSQNKYQLSSLDGGTLNVRVWKGTVAPTSPGSNYYGKASNAVASGTTLPYDWTCSINTSYKADVPYKPTIGAISESLVRSGTSLNLTLVVPISYDLSGPGGDGLRETTGYSLDIVYPSGKAETKSGSSITLSGSDATSGTYKFTPHATNWYGTTDGDPITYATLGVAAGAGGTVTYNLTKLSGGLGVNSIGIPFDAPMTFTAGDGTTATVNTLQDLIDALKSTGVTATAYWDNTNQALAGNAYDASGAQTYATSGFDPKSITLKAGTSYYLSISNSVTFTLQK